MASYVKRHIRKSQGERRQEILDATLELISEDGADGVTVARIAAAVGVTPGALYRHFESRAALIAEAHRLANRRAADWVESSHRTDIPGRLEELGETHAIWARENFNTVVRLFFMSLVSTPDPDDQSRLSISRFASFQDIVSMADDGKQRGEIREDVPAEDVAWAMHMHMFTEDLAVMAGEGQASMAALRRNLKRLLDSFATHAADPEQTPGP